MRKSISPWIYQLNRKRLVSRLKKNHQADVAIIGGGIAGIATAYFVLRETKHKVTLIEAWKIAHGATGHNGGFLASYFERTFTDMVKEFGPELTVKGQQDVDSAWDLLEEIRTILKIKTPMWQFTGYAACASLEEVLLRLDNNLQRKEYGLSPELILVSEEIKSQIPSKYYALCQFVPKLQLLETLETDDAIYIAALASRKGCMNSAAFCEEVVSKLKRKYPKRFTIAEHTSIKNVVLRENSATLYSQKGQIIAANKVVLCTNGFEKLTITNIAGADINTKFHHLVRGIVGYMAAYVEEGEKAAAEISYLPKNEYRREDLYQEDPYYYLTRRPFEDPKRKNKKLNLISVGGPEALMDDTNKYSLEHPFPDEAKKGIDNFLRYTYKHGVKEKIKYKFLWHGLMGFTPNGVRCVGAEPLNPVLYYNLGCNGVGLLPSIFGGRKIAMKLIGKDPEPSIFDPKTSLPQVSGISSGELPETIMFEHTLGAERNHERVGIVLLYTAFILILLTIYMYFLSY